MSVCVRSLTRFAIFLLIVSGRPAIQPMAASARGEQANQIPSTIIASRHGYLQMSPIHLPLDIRGWKQTGNVQRITRETIFDYMNGAGELYIGYRFRELEVREYESDQNGPILVELYFMESPDDAFGLLSLDWGGEVLDEAIGGSGFQGGRWPFALYGSGLLRMRAGSLYVRMLAEQDTAATRQGIIELAGLVAKAALKPTAPPPALLAALPDAVGDYSIASTGKAFLRSHLVLNSVYFLATRNILQLGPDCEAVSSEYRRQGELRKPRLLVIRYRFPEAAVEAARDFEQIYLATPRRKTGPTEWGVGQARAIEIEDGWVGIGRSGAFLAVAFDCPDDETAREFLNGTGTLLTRMESGKLEGQ